MPTHTVEELIQQIDAAFQAVLREKDDHLRKVYKERLAKLRKEVEGLDGKSMTRFKKWFRVNPYKRQYVAFDEMWNQYEVESMEATELRGQGAGEYTGNVDGASSVSLAQSRAPAPIDRPILSQQELDAILTMDSQGPGTAYASGTPQGAYYGHYGSGAPQGPPMGPLYARGNVNWNGPGPGFSQGLTTGQNNQYSGQGYQPQGPNSLPLPPRRWHNPAQYSSGQPQAGPSQQHMGHNRMFSTSTFGNPRSSGELNQNQPNQHQPNQNQSDPRSSGESSGSGTSYHTAREFQPMYPDGSSSGGGYYGYGHY